jgi:hypothetical protein
VISGLFLKKIVVRERKRVVYGWGYAGDRCGITSSGSFTAFRMTAKGNKAGKLWLEMCGGLLRNSSLGILHFVQDDSKGKGKGKGKAKAKADPPFDFAQGRLFGMTTGNAMVTAFLRGMRTEKRRHGRSEGVTKLKWSAGWKLDS